MFVHVYVCECVHARACIYICAYIVHFIPELVISVYTYSR